MDLMILGTVAWWANALAILFFIICVFLILIVLLQKGKGGGLSAAFGGAGGQSAFGSKTGDVFTWVTIVVVAVFFLLAIVLAKNYKPKLEPEEMPASMLTAPPGPGAGQGEQPMIPADSSGYDSGNEAEMIETESDDSAAVDNTSESAGQEPPAEAPSN